MKKLLIIEDEKGLVEGLTDALEHHGFQVGAARDGATGLEMAQSGDFDLIILDLMLPGMDGLDVCRGLRRARIETPIIMLTARGEEADRVAGLEVGADDYVTKPFSVRELVARVRAILRRTDEKRPEPETIIVGSAEIDFKKFVVIRGGQESRLTDLEVKLLRYFLERPHEVVSRGDLLDQIWGYNAYPTTRTVDTFVYRLRRKIEGEVDKPRYLQTVHGVGYRFVP